jgi:UDP-N-acetylglucosamine--N-acetylmuramyl-(pentapeptide) pyrophosphoryl-undecaprenol N-acetylglucosamine transferase
MKVLISGGGTGGHIYPALAIIKEIQIKAPDSEFLYVGTAQGLEADIVKKANIPFQSIEITGFKRKLSFDNVKTIYRFLKGVRASKKLIHAFKPDIVIGTGGYVCGPIVFAATRMNIPTLIHEQNVIPGLTNQFLARYTSAVAVSFEGSAPHFKHPLVQVTGNPRATEVAQANGSEGRKSLHIPPYKTVILVIGGSRGAKSINQAFLDIANRVDQIKDSHFIYVTGDIHYESVKQRLKEQEISMDQITLQPFIYNMPDVLAGTDIIINRAGASFLAEITSLGIPAILIPSPYVTNNHQEKNARWLEGEGAAQVILENELNGDTLWQGIIKLSENDEYRNKMREASKQLGHPEASDHIYQLIQKLLK